MKLFRYSNGSSGSEKPGIVDEDGTLRDLSHLVTDINPPLLSDLSRLAALDTRALPPLSDAPRPRFAPCVSGTGKIICIGLNYADHARETGARPPAEPVIFMKATSALCGAGDTIVLPRESERTDWEVELGVVIGKTAKYISEADAPQHIAGYCVANDISERAFQKERQGQWTKGKSCDTFAPIGPYLVSADAVPDPQNLRLWLEVNGERRQDDTTANMLYSVTFLLSYLSQFMSLHPGDIIFTGTPPGVGMGMTPPRFLAAGDTIRAGIEGLGEQHLTVAAAD